MIKRLKSSVSSSLVTLMWLWVVVAYLAEIIPNVDESPLLIAGKSYGVFSAALLTVLFQAMPPLVIIFIVVTILAFIPFTHFGGDHSLVLIIGWYGFFVLGTLALINLWLKLKPDHSTRKGRLRVGIISLDQGLLHSNGDTLNRFQSIQKQDVDLSVIIPTQDKFAKLIKDPFMILPCYGPHPLISHARLFLCLFRLNVDVVVTNTPELGLLATIPSKIMGFKVQISVFGVYRNGIRWYIQKCACILADSIRVDTHQDKAYLIDNVEILPAKVYVIPVVPSQVMQQTFLKTTKVDPKKEKTVLAIGTLTPNKDFGNLIKAAKIVTKRDQKVKFLIVGDGPLARSLRREASGLPIHFHSNVSYSKLPAFYHQANLFVCSSYQEGLPRVLMEAALSGCPIVTTDIPGAFDLITDHRTGSIVPKKDAGALAQAILWHLENQKKSIRMGEQAQKHALAYLDFNQATDALISSWLTLV